MGLQNWGAQKIQDKYYRYYKLYEFKELMGLQNWGAQNTRQI